MTIAVAGTGSPGNLNLEFIKVFSAVDWHLVSMADFSDTARPGHPVGWGFRIDRLAFQPGTHNLAIGMHGGFGIPRGAPLPCKRLTDTSTGSLD